MTHFDLAVIGTGSGYSLVTPDFDGKRVAIIESGTFGGTCMNVECIPTKMYVFAADVANAITHAARNGIDATLGGARWSDIRDRMFGRIDPVAAGAKDYRVTGPNTTAFLGHATFTGPKSLRIDSGIDVGRHHSRPDRDRDRRPPDRAPRGQRVGRALRRLRHRDAPGRAPESARYPRIWFRRGRVRP